ncbi:MAG: Zn-dependent hydrolase [Gammaproteobacteria bacterium]|nr:Zn-dependent hydrolase [Gammaproteobacteria bacterium]
MLTVQVLRKAVPFLLVLAAGGCSEPADQQEAPAESPAVGQERAAEEADLTAYVGERLDIYAPVRLTADLSELSANQKSMLPILIDASKIMDELFWRQAWGDRAALFERIDDEATGRFARLNYGPWDRLNGDRPFVPGIGPKPPGANFYPPDMTAAEYESAALDDGEGLYSLIRRDEQGQLEAVPYHVAYAAELERAAALLRRAAALAADPQFEKYLELRAAALASDDYLASDLAWMEMKSNRIDVVIGAIETYEDALFGARAAYESYVLLKDEAWSKRLARFVEFLPALQRGLPVPDAYKAETPGSESDLNVYDVLYYAGHSNAGAKTIAINLPNDERVQLEKGTRRLQLKNAMRAKFDKILAPVAETLIVPGQQPHVTFDAFFANTLFHEVAHGLGIKNTLDGKETVREALKELASPVEEGKADILGLYMITSLFEEGEMGDGELMDNYVTFLAGLFRSVRFGASEAHGQANMVTFNFLAERGAFERDEQSGLYRVDSDGMQRAIDALSERILTLQGDGDYAGVQALLDEMGRVGPELQADLDRLEAIPVDVVFEQGKEVLGL